MTGLLHVPVRRNDWRPLKPPAIESWCPDIPVSVVIPAYGSESTLPLTLAALAEQDYPSSKLEVVVVDDAGTLTRLPDRRPENTRLIRSAKRHGWGPAAARQSGAEVAEGTVIHWLDADMLPYRQHVKAQVRWHATCDYAVTLGYKQFVSPPFPTVEEVAAAVKSGAEEGLFAGRPREGHAWVEREIDATESLATAWPQAFRVHVGATATVGRALFFDAGGMDVELHQGEDSELGYRLYNAGACFIPERRARSWHLGMSTVMRNREAVLRHNAPFITQRMPLPRFRRRTSRILWRVPVCYVELDVRSVPLEVVRPAIDALLASDTADLVVGLVGNWADLTDERRNLLADPLLDLRLLAEWCAADPRLIQVDAHGAPASSVPAGTTFILRLPPQAVVGPGSVTKLIEFMGKRQLGLLTLLVERQEAPDLVARMERVASFRRAERIRAAGDLRETDELVATVGGTRVADAADFSVRCLT